MHPSERLLRLVPPFRRSLDQVVRHAAEWERRNEAVLAEGPYGPPLWVVLGDSTAQAVGLADVDDGYVVRVRWLLERRDGVPWRVLNLSRSGAVLADVLDVQLPRLRELTDWSPALVTAVVGSNDLRRSSQPALLHGIRRITAELPEGAALGTLPRGLHEGRAREANALLRQLAAARGLRLVDLWAVTGPPWRGKYADGLHPGPAGVTDWVRAFVAALDLPAEQDPPLGRPRLGSDGA